MARIELAPGEFDDFDRCQAHWDKFDVPDAADCIQAIVAALDILRSSPLVARPARGGKPELVIGRGSREYVALYRYLPRLDMVVVLALRSQREKGHKRRKQNVIV